eukprot:TRINITY_DN382_c1_g1_i1.p1 TRINITY_DN382_c1_g1~~TRINITY_DN382_c1_g1_i1.p1  ORF type:complete len:206 (+),score=35.25 TRINITY_DN382_c1_g1_i1:56-673(+)
MEPNKKAANRNWTYILRIGSFISGGGLIAAGVLGFVTLSPLQIIVSVYLIVLGFALVVALLPFPKTWRLLTLKYVPFLHTYRGRGLYMIFIGTLATGTGWIAIIIGVVVTLIGLAHIIIAFFFRDALDRNKDLEKQMNHDESVTYDGFKKEMQQAAVQTAWDNKEIIAQTAYDNREAVAQTAYDNREFVTDNAGTFAQVAVTTQY